MKHDGPGDHAEAGEDYYDQRDARNHDHLVRHHQQALARLGYHLTLTPPGDGSQPKSPDPQPARWRGARAAVGGAARRARVPMFRYRSISSLCIWPDGAS